MNATDTLEYRIKAFKSSSSFTPGDPQSFSIALSEDVALPGRFDPLAYVEQFGSEANFGDKNVLVVCPGNGGLCVAALRGGASTVVAVEPRTIYDRALTSVSDFASEVIGATFSRRASGERLVEKFDVVFWTEGLDEVAHPKALFEAAIASLAPGGRLFIEVAHGTHGVLPESTNSWRPTKDGFKATIAALGTVALVSELEGRDQVRSIYVVQDNETRVEREIREGRAELAEKMKPFVSDDYINEKILQKDPVRIPHTAFPEGYAEAKTEEEKVELLSAAAEALAKQQKALIEAGHLPTPKTPAQEMANKIKSMLPTETPVVGDFDSIYEGRASTPKSKKTKKTARQSKKGKPKP